MIFENALVTGQKSRQWCRIYNRLWYSLCQSPAIDIVGLKKLISCKELTYDTADDIITSLEIIEKLLFPETDFCRNNYLKSQKYNTQVKYYSDTPKICLMTVTFCKLNLRPFFYEYAFILESYYD